MALTLLVVAGTRPERYSIPSIIAFGCVIGLGLAMIVWRRNRWERADARRPHRPPESAGSLHTEDASTDEPSEPGPRETHRPEGESPSAQ
jgi:uncharacterized membrane protein YccC